MRYTIRPDSLLERLALWTDMVPLPAIDVLVPLIKVRAIMAGVRLGIFSALSPGPLSSGELAARLELDAECLRLLLRVLVSSEYLTQRDEHFALTRRASELHAYVEFNYLQWHFVEGLEQTLRTGCGVEFHRTLPEPSDWQRYQHAMLDLARPVAGTIAAHVPVPKGARRLLDLGGSHGLIGAALCRAHPPMRSTVLELPPAVAHAKQLALDEGIADVVEHRAGDALASNYGADYDVVLLCNLLHHLSEREVGLVLLRAVEALRGGGTIAVWETEFPRSDSKPELAGDALALYFRITSSSPGLGPNVIEEKLRALGCDEVETTRTLRAPGRVLLCGKRRH